MPAHQEAIDYFHKAFSAVQASQWAGEIEYQRTLHPSQINEQKFLAEYAWVVLNSGFRESVVRKKFDYISLCFFDWESAQYIANHADICIETASSSLGNHQKLCAITTTASIIAKQGFNSLWQDVLKDPISVLPQLPFIGPITVWHLAKSFGFPVAKPDRHLQRLTSRFGFDDTQALCAELADASRERIDVIDAILWRYEAERTQLEALQ